MARMRGAAGRAATAAAAGTVRATAPSATACRSVRKRAAVMTRAGMPQGLRLTAWTRVALLPPPRSFSTSLLLSGVLGGRWGGEADPPVGSPGAPAPCLRPADAADDHRRRARRDRRRAARDGRGRRRAGDGR